MGYSSECSPTPFGTKPPPRLGCQYCLQSTRGGSHRGQHSDRRAPNGRDTAACRARPPASGRRPLLLHAARTRPYRDPDTDEASITLELALPLLEDAAGSRVNGVIGASDPYIVARDELERGEYNEVIISTLPERISHWLRQDLPHRVEQLGVLVTVVTAAGIRSAVTDRGA
jgi:hypothetical protein